jgi:GNAT superfamily N-acetyltransferase
MWRDIGGRTPGDIARAGPAYRRWIRREVAHRRFLAFVVEDRSGRTAGSGAVWISPVHPRPGRLSRLSMPYILSMYTEPAFRRRGVASRIVRAMVRWAKDHGYRRVYLHASRMGRPVYARLGFVLGREMRFEW